MLFKNKKYALLLIIILLVSGLALLQAVFSFPLKVSNSQINVRNDKEILNQYFDLSKLPKANEVKWIQEKPGKISMVPGPTDYAVTAVLSYEESTTPLIKGFQLKSQEVYVSESLLESWVPLPVRKSFIRTQENYLKYEGQGYSAQPFLKSPLSSGWILFIDNYIILFGATS
ncbi:MAG TPA: hypothetical protein VD999_00415 [Vitreimonas sp.]|nr:hypothetical protein [Vitreimonas sp.]